MTHAVGPVLLRGIDAAAFAAAFGDRLRARGVRIGFTQVAEFATALTTAPPSARSELYWMARVTLVRRREDHAVFDAVFAAAFDEASLDLSPPARAQGQSRSSGDALVRAEATAPEEQEGSGLPWVTPPRTVNSAEESTDDASLLVPQRLPSADDALADVPFEHLDPADMEQLRTWLGLAVTAWPTRPSRRFVVDPAGRRVAMRHTIARARRTAWEPVRLVHVKAARRPRRVVLLCDVSRSMQPQVQAYLHLMRALAVHTDAEVFAFATSLTRLTPALQHRSIDVAVGQATERVTDRFGGTRIAANLRLMLGSHHGELVRGAIVVIGSDGWDSDPPEEMDAAMKRLRRRAHRVIWMNPRAGSAGFEPRVSTMAAALPYCDRFLPGDTFRSLAEVIKEITGCEATAGRP